MSSAMPHEPLGRVLLTGATGLLGAWLRRTAPTELDLVALVHRSPLDGLPPVHADLRDRDATLAALRAAAPALVLHAAYATDRPSIVDATAHVVEAAAAAGADVLLTSTDAVFAGDGRPRAEGDVPEPVHDYGRWKLEAEAIVLAASATATVVRLPLLVSVGPDDPVVAAVRAAATGDGRGPTWFTDEVRRPALASEVAAALWRIAAVAPAERAGIWHLAGSERLSRHQLAERIAGHLGLSSAHLASGPTPPGLARPRDLEWSADRARQAIGWEPSPVLAPA